MVVLNFGCRVVHFAHCDSRAGSTLALPCVATRCTLSRRHFLGSGLWRTSRVTIQLLLLMSALSPVSLSGAEEPIQKVKIKAKRFKFVPSKIKVKAGTTLEIVLSSQDVRHGFKIVGTDIDVEIPARGKGQVKARFKTDKAGKYRFECSRVCGAGHASMRGVIQVAEPKQNKPEAGPEERGERE